MPWNFFDALNNDFKNDTFVFNYSLEFFSIRLSRSKNLELIEIASDKCKHRSILFQLDDYINFILKGVDLYDHTKVFL